MSEGASPIIPPRKSGKSPIVGPGVGSSGRRRGFSVPQWLMWVMMAGIVLLMIFTKSLFKGPSEARVDDLGKNGQHGTIGRKAFEETWMSEEGGKISVLEKQVEELNRQLKDVKGRVSKKPTVRSQATRSTTAFNPTDMLKHLPPKLAAPPPQAPAPPPPLPPREKKSKAPLVAPPSVSPAILQEDMGPTLIPDSSQHHLLVVTAKAPLQSQEAETTKTFHLPTGTIMSGRLLMGVNAPTLDAGANNPHPMLMEVTDLGILPNEFQLDVQACFVTGEGVGSISSERVDVRLLRMSCVREDHEAVDVVIKGVAVDSDGVGGISGNVVWKEKALLMRALAAGTVQGISQAFQPFSRGFTISRNAQDAFNFPDPRQAGLAGIAGGVGQAAEELTRFYTGILRQIVPVIEVKPGRKINMVVTEGRELPKPLLAKQEGS